MGPSNYPAIIALALLTFSFHNRLCEQLSTRMPQNYSIKGCISFFPLHAMMRKKKDIIYRGDWLPAEMYVVILIDQGSRVGDVKQDPRHGDG